jgi:hypothetical protein
VTVTFAVCGGLATQGYTLRANITNPVGATHSGSASATTNSTGYATFAAITYPTDFGTATTNYVGTYSMTLDRTAPGKVLDIPFQGASSFEVVLTNGTTFRRYQTVSIRGGGYGATESVTVDIKNPAGSSVSGYPKAVSASAGVVTDTWGPIATTAPLGTYTVTLTGATTTKTPADTSTFTMKGALLSVTKTVEPTTAASYSRTSAVGFKFTASYPNGDLFNYTNLGSVTVGIYYNETMQTEMALSSANYDISTAEWSATWVIPKDTPIGWNYSFRILPDDIVDSVQNSGPDIPGVMSNWFNVTTASVVVTPVGQPTAYYNRTQSATYQFQLSYPDLTIFDSSLLGTVCIGVHNGTHYFQNLSLTAAAYTAPYWTASWNIPWNASETLNYRLAVLGTQTKDMYGNPVTSTVQSNPFDVEPCVLAVPAITVDQSMYEVNSIVDASFAVTYLDGSYATTGFGYLKIMRPDGTITYMPATFNNVTNRWEVKFTATYPVGIYTLTVEKNFFYDLASPSNWGPGADVSTTFTVYEEVTLAMIVERLDALEESIVPLIEDAMAATIVDLEDTIAALEDTIGDLALKTDVSAVKTDVAAVKSTVDSLKTSMEALALKTDVDAARMEIYDYVQDLQAHLGVLIDDLSAAVEDMATQAELDAVSGTLGSLNTYVLIAVVLSLIAAIGAILSFFMVYRKVA